MAKIKKKWRGAGNLQKKGESEENDEQKSKRKTKRKLSKKESLESGQGQRKKER